MIIHSHFAVLCCRYRKMVIGYLSLCAYSIAHCIGTSHNKMPFHNTILIDVAVVVVVNVQVTEARLGNDRHYVSTRCNVQHAQSIHRYTEATGDIYYLHAVAMLYYFQ